MIEHGFVYVMESGVGFCKIGFAKDVESRKMFIQSEMGINITRTHKFNSSSPRHDEQKIHKMLSTNRLFREWFYISFEDEVVFITENINKKMRLNTPSERAKELGCRSLAQVVKVMEMPERTLHDWFKNYPKRFDMACVYTREVKYGKVEV